MRCLSRQLLVHHLARVRELTLQRIPFLSRFMPAAITTKTIGGKKPPVITGKDPELAKKKLLEMDKLVGPAGDTRRLLNEALALL